MSSLWSNHDVAVILLSRLLPLPYTSLELSRSEDTTFPDILFINHIVLFI